MTTANPLAVTVDGIGVDVAPDFAPTLLKNAFKGSLVGRVTTSEPVSMAGTVIPVYNGGIEVGLVGEAQAKPKSGFSTSTLTITPQKVATIVVVSKEAAMVNPARMLDNVEKDLVDAISRAVDHLVLFNKDPRGNAYSGSNKCVVTEDTAAVELAEGFTNDDYAAALISAYEAAAIDASPSAWLFDDRQRVKNVVVSQDRRQDVGLPNLNEAGAHVLGLPAHYGKAVSGRSTVVSESNGIRGIVGDFDKVRWGFVERLGIQRSTEATINGESMFETNQVALLVEAILGWTVVDQGAFAVVRDAAEETGGEED